ncbi:putative serine/threonine-protein kinase Cx32, chloroplastic [Senna tora]|uniref:non-specific serine/threonine protein kinase n=1 Tax=Senna tora TaxID=362788 RepID=A0A834ST99_9FABA|nr:putative serine/threonine-protein kinase Cx32, chloroplastic [Senna tora]
MGLCIGCLAPARHYNPRRPQDSDYSGNLEKEESDNSGEEIRGNYKLKEFSMGELKAATKNFKTETLVGEGGFGKVYRGWLDGTSLSPTKPGSGIMVAIKRLNPNSMQGLHEWQSEVKFQGTLSHPNLVKLLGYCGGHHDDAQELLLVLKIAIGAAQGLAFLHTNSENQIIYRDFKASNVLLDSNYNAKISDFGLAKLGPTAGETHVTTRIMGTFGYAAPEYVATGHLYVKSDVYGFGVVLLELLTGMRALDPKRLNGQQNLVEWIKPCLSNKRKLKSMIDDNIKGQYSIKAALEVAQLSLKCIQHEPKDRPSMKDVVEALQDIQALQHKNSKRIGVSLAMEMLDSPSKLEVTVVPSEIPTSLEDLFAAKVRGS